MSQEKIAGVFQLENGYWGYRFIVKANGKRKAQKRVQDENGKPYKTEKQALKAREKAIILEKTRMSLPPQKEIIKKKVEEVYKEYCENGRIKMPSKKSIDVKEIESYSKREIQIMDKYFAGKPVYTAYLIGKYTGLRVAECFGLTWDCIDLKNGIIYVKNARRNYKISSFKNC